MLSGVSLQPLKFSLFSLVKDCFLNGLPFLMMCISETESWKDIKPELSEPLLAKSNECYMSLWLFCVAVQFFQCPGLHVVMRWKLQVWDGNYRLKSYHRTHIQKMVEMYQDSKILDYINIRILTDPLTKTKIHFFHW